MEEQKKNSTSLSIHSAIASQPSSKITKLYESAAKKYNFTKVKTPLQALESESLSLITMRARDKQVCETVMSYMIAKTAKKFNIGKNINPEQIRETLESIFEDYYYLKLSDLYLVLRNGVKGKYGQIYDRFDESVLMGWMEKYTEERFKVAEERQLARHDAVTSDEKGRKYNGFVNDLYKKWKK